MLEKYKKDLTNTNLKIANLEPTLQNLSNDKTNIIVEMNLQLKSAEEILERNNAARMTAFKQTGFVNDVEFKDFWYMKNQSDQIYASFLLMVESTTKFIESLDFQISKIIDNIHGNNIANTIHLFTEIRDKWERDNEIQLPPNFLGALKEMCKNYNEDIFDDVRDIFKEMDLSENDVYNLITREEGVDKAVEDLSEKIMERQGFSGRIIKFEKETADMEADYKRKIKVLEDSKDGKRGEEKEEIMEQISNMKEEMTDKKEKLKEAITELKGNQSTFTRLIPKCLRLICNTLIPIVTLVLNPYQKKTLINTIESSMAPGGLLQITMIYNRTTQNLISM